MDPCVIVAEVAQAHDGSLGTAHAYIDAIATTGADAVKFQIHKDTARNEPWRIRFSQQDESRWDYWQRTGFSMEQWSGLRTHAAAVKLKFGASAFNVHSLECVRELEPDFWKLPAGKITDKQILDQLSWMAGPIYISTGMATASEIDNARQALDTSDVVLLQCTSKYPCGTDGVGLNVLAWLRKNFPFVPVGLSDHSGTIYPGIAAAYLGISVLEVHVKLSDWSYGPDAVASITIDELKTLVEGVRFIQECKANPVDKEQMAKSLAHEREVFMR
jgi:N-acetylneuraminate synthase